MSEHITLHKSTVKDIYTCGYLGAAVVAGYKKPTTRPMGLGTHCHAVWVEGCQKWLSIEEILERETDDEALAILETTFGSDPHLNEALVVYEHYMAIDEAGNYLPGVKEVEADVSPFIAGTVDRMMPPAAGWRKGLLVVEDYKTGWVEATFRPEIVFYLLLAWADCKALHIPVERARFVYFYGRTGRRISFDYDGTFEELLAEAHQIAGRCHEILANPVPIPGDHCAFCSMMTTECPLFKNLPITTDTRIGALIDRFVGTGYLLPADAPAVGLAAQALDGKMAELKAAMKDWVRTNGPIFCGEKRWAITENDGDKWDQETAWNILEKASPTDRQIALGVDTRRLQKLRKSNPDLVRTLYKYARLPGQPVERFGLTKI